MSRFVERISGSAMSPFLATSAFKTKEHAGLKAIIAALEGRSTDA
jgi:hypothetical protein